MIKVYSMVEDEVVLCDSGKEVLEALKKFQHGNNGAIVRCSSDKDYFSVVVAINTRIQEAQQSAMMLTGAQVKVWNLQNVFTEGEGWRLVLGCVVVANQPQAVPPNGGRPLIARG